MCSQEISCYMEKICHWLLIVGNRRFGLIKPSSVKWKRKYAIEYDSEKSGIVYKISCTQCNFVYYGQTERSLKTRIVEHKKAVASFDQNSKVAGHVHLFGHRMNFENVEVVGFESNYHERLFLEAWHSTLDPNSGNDHILRLEAYKGIARAWITWSRAQASRHVTFNSVWQRISFSFHWWRLKHQPKRLLPTIKSQWQTFSIIP